MPERLRGPGVVAVMVLAVIATYWPPDSESLHGTDFAILHARRLRYAQEALLGPLHTLPGWYTRELGGTPFWSNIQNFPLIPTRLPLLLMEPANAFGAGVQMAAVLAAVFTYLYGRRLGLGSVAAGSVQVRYAPTYPEVADHRVRLAAGQASRTTLEIAKAGSRVLDDRRLIRQIIRGDKLSDASPKLLMVIAIASPPPPVTR